MKDRSNLLAEIWRFMGSVIIIVVLLTKMVESLVQKDSREVLTKDTFVRESVLEPISWDYREEDDTYFPVLEHGRFKIPSRVVFSRVKPTMSPSQGTTTSLRVKRFAKIKKNLSNKRRKNRKRKRRRNRKSKRKRRHHHGARSRRRRSHSPRLTAPPPLIPIPACNTVEDFVQLNESRTPFKLTVQVESSIEVDGKRWNQMIYETKCSNEGTPCQGIDTEHYMSECVTQKIFVYAYVRNRNEKMWTQIEVNGACNCRLFRKQMRGPSRILDLLNIMSES